MTSHSFRDFPGPDILAPLVHGATPPSISTFGLRRKRKVDIAKIGVLPVLFSSVVCFPGGWGRVPSMSSGGLVRLASCRANYTYDVHIRILATVRVRIHASGHRSDRILATSRDVVGINGLRAELTSVLVAASSAQSRSRCGPVIPATCRN